ncbi:hypothetical protein ACFWN2_08735 [Lentzea sp. NPDC058436]|uniref:hypothetical protein n=1 Tax=Lentzea sp. NPDC058436 TaxID=3346499 RepID=UPI003654C081
MKRGSPRCRRLRLPHRLTIVTPAEHPTSTTTRFPCSTTASGLPPRRGRDAATRTSATTAEPGRQAVTGTWWAFTLDPIHARERVEYDGRVYQVEGAPEHWEPGWVEFISRRL